MELDKVTHAPAPKKRHRDFVFFVSDLHCHALHEPTYNIFLQHLRMVERLRKTKAVVVIGGDFLDAPFLMKKKNPDYRRYLKTMSGIDEYFVPLAEQEFSWGNKILDEIQALSDAVYFLEGNHDFRYREFGHTDCPHNYRHNFDLVENLSLSKRKIPFIKYNHWLDFGNTNGLNGISLTHGMYHNSRHTLTHWQVCGARNVLYGHLHKFEVAPFTCRGRTTHAYTNACMSTLSPEWLKDKENNWSNGYTTFIINCDSDFHLVQHKILNDRLTLPDGTVLKG